MEAEVGAGAGAATGERTGSALKNFVLAALDEMRSQREKS